MRLHLCSVCGEEQDAHPDTGFCCDGCECRGGKSVVPSICRTVTLDERHHAALVDMADALEMSIPQVCQAAVRLYQLSLKGKYEFEPSPGCGLAE